MGEDGVLPKLQKGVSDFASEERGQITKQSLLSVGGILAAGAALSALAASAAATPQTPINRGELGGCSGHSNSILSSHVDNVSLPGTVQAQHADSPAWSAHCNHGNHSSY